MILLEHIKDDWRYRLPHRLRTNRYRGLSRPSFALICLVYYSVKSLILLCFYLLFRVYKFIFWDIWAGLYHKLHPNDIEDDDDAEESEAIEEEECTVDDDTDEIGFCQLFPVGKEMCLLVDRIEMCPDETAFIRVLDDEGYTPLYKRKVRRDKNGNRFIVFNSTNHYLDDKKTQPVITNK